MKQIVVLINILFLLLLGCDSTEEKDENSNTSEIVQNEIPIENEEATAVPVGEETPIVPIEEKIIKSYSIKPIDENVLFYYFTDNKILYKFKGYDKEKEYIIGIINYEDGSTEEKEINLAEFFINKNDQSELRFAWLIKDGYFDNENIWHNNEYKYYSQKNGIVEQLWDGTGYRDFVSFRERENYGIMETEEFRLEINSYNKFPVNDLYYKSNNKFIRFKQISKIYEINSSEWWKNGVYFNVLISNNSTYLKGLYFMMNNRTSIDYQNIKGRMWIK